MAATSLRVTKIVFHYVSCFRYCNTHIEYGLNE